MGRRTSIRKPSGENGHLAVAAIGPSLENGEDMTKVMVTGASGGIGAAIARRFAERGCELVVVAPDW